MISAARNQRNVLCSLALTLGIISAFCAHAHAQKDSGVPEGLDQQGSSGVIVGDTVPFTPGGMPTSPPPSSSPQFAASPPPFSSDPGVVSPSTAMFTPARPSSNPNRIPVFRDLTPSTREPARTPEQPASNPDQMGSQFPDRMPSQFPEEMGVEDARKYMVLLINRDRQTQGLRNVTLDELATRAGQGHTDEMVEYCYHGHWSLNGKKPDQRYTEAGGRNAVAENAWFSATHGETNSSPRVIPVDAQPVFDKRQLEGIEASFFNEVPPNDGHRKNILNPNHTSVGIALSKASQGEEWPRAGCTEEFINRYGDYAPIPDSTASGSHFNVSGKLHAGTHLWSIDVMEEPLPKPMSVEELNQTGGYNNPTNRVATYWPIAQQGSRSIEVRGGPFGEEFNVEVEVFTTYGFGRCHPTAITNHSSCHRAQWSCSRNTN
jgi:uncharacterized protein YkwD